MNNTQLLRFPYKSFSQFSHFDNSFIEASALLTPFLRSWPSIPSLLDYKRKRNFPSERRQTLIEAVKGQMESIGLHEQVSSRLEILKKENAATLITAHQPVLFGGPLYTIYKIASTINLSRQLNAALGSEEVVPIFIVGGEDHDKEEMDHLQLFGKSLVWETDQTGPVGRFSNEGLKEMIEEITEILGTSPQDVRALLEESFTTELSYGQGYQYFIQSLFMREGLLVVSMDDPVLKSSFAPLIQREILERPSQSLVEATQKQLEDLGFKKQAHAREINFFYLGNGNRSLIESQESDYIIEGEVWSEGQLLKELEENPQDFSPNVVMRPIYQEYSFPNLAYIGGGGELAYWTERKSQFEAFEVPFPILVRRNSAGIIDGFIQKKMQKVPLSPDDLSSDLHELIKKVVSKETDMDERVQAHREKIISEFMALSNEVEKFDPTIAKYTVAEAKKLENTLDNVASKIIRSVKKREEDTVRHIEKTYDHLFPSGGLQERKANFLPYYSKYGDAWLSYLIDNLDPLKSDFIFLLE